MDESEDVGGKVLKGIPPELVEQILKDYFQNSLEQKDKQENKPKQEGMCEMKINLKNINKGAMNSILDKKY